MMKGPIVFLAAFGLCAGTALAHHGWGSYDAAKPITVAGPILTSKYENPHVTITVRASDKVWTVTLAPTFAHDQSRRDAPNGGGRQDGFGLRLSLDRREGRDARRAHHGGRQDLEMR